MKSKKLNKAHRLARANYLPRVIGFAASFLMIALLVIEREWSYWNFLFSGFFFLAYPHIVYWGSRFAPDGKKVEISAMMVDAFMLGIWTVHIHFVLWISYSFLTATVLNHMMIGGFRQLFKGIGYYLAGVLIWGTIIGFQLQPNAPFYIELIAMVSLLIFITSVAWTFYYVNDRLAKIKMQQEGKNKELEETLQELDATRNELVEKAHKAGMADIASGVLHNVGNLLNSVNTSASLIETTIKKSKLEKLEKANTILREHIGHIEEYIANNPNGKNLLNYYLKLEEPLKTEHDEVLRQSSRLVEKINLINDVIAAQQTYAGASIHASQTSLNEMIDNALTLQAGSIERHGLIVKKDLQATDTILAQRSKLIHILVNIFKNAKESMDAHAPEEKKITIKTWQDQESVYLSVTDNGPGIKPEHLGKIFSQGFTTKKNGHGFGLHSSANYIMEMGGSIDVHSEGEGKGTVFTLKFSKPGAVKNEMGPAAEEVGNINILDD